MGKTLVTAPALAKEVRALIDGVLQAEGDWEMAHAIEDNLYQKVAMDCAPAEIRILLEEYQEKIKGDTRWYA